MFPGARLFENALSSLGRSQAQCRKPKTLGLKEIKHPESPSQDSPSSPTEIREASISVFQNPSSMLFEETHNSISTKAACRAKESSLQTATTQKDEYSIPMSQQRPPPGFVPSNVYSPLNYQVHPSTASYDFSSVPEMHSTDFCTYTSKAPTSYSSHPSSFIDNLLAPMNYSFNSMPLPTFLTAQPSPPSNQDNGFYLNSPYSLSTPTSHEELRQSLLSLSITDLNPSCSLSSHEEMRESLYSMTATDLALQMYGKLPDSPSESTLSLNSQDSGCQLSDDNDSSESPSQDSSSSPTEIREASIPVFQNPSSPQPSPPSNQDNAFYLNSPYSLSTPTSHEELRQSLLSLSITDLNPSSSPRSHEKMQQSLYSASATDWNPNCILSSHEEMLESLYSMTATDLVLQMYGKLPDSPSDCTLPLNSQDSDYQLSDDNDSSGTSTTDSTLFTDMSYYHMANTPELAFTVKQILNEVPPVEKRSEPKQASNTLISGRVNRLPIQLKTRSVPIPVCQSM